MDLDICYTQSIPGDFSVLMGMGNSGGIERNAVMYVCFYQLKDIRSCHHNPAKSEDPTVK